MIEYIVTPCESDWGISLKTTNAQSMGLEPAPYGVKEDVMQRIIQVTSIFKRSKSLSSNLAHERLLDQTIGSEFESSPTAGLTPIKKRWALQPVRRCTAGMCT